MGAAENKQLTQSVFDQLANGNGQPFMDALAADVRWTVIGSSPWSRTYEGKEAFLTPVFSSNPPMYQKGDAVKVVYRGQGESARILTFASRFGLAWPLMCAGLALVIVALGFKYGDALLISRFATPAAPFGR